MAALFRLSLLGLLFVVGSCASRDEARQGPGLAPQPEVGSQIPAGSPGPGYEKVKTRPNATPTPPPTNPLDKPLDPTGLPQG
jgi:hypothetical protein